MCRDSIWGSSPEYSGINSVHKKPEDEEAKQAQISAINAQMNSVQAQIRLCK